MANETTTQVEGQAPVTDTQTTEAEKAAAEALEAEAAKKAAEDEEALPEHVARKELKEARAEAAKYRTQLRETQEQLSAAKTPEEQAAALKDLTDKNVSLEREVVAARFKLPAILAGRIQGVTREEMEADAKELAKSVRNSTDPDDLEGGLDSSKGGQTQADINAAVNNILRKRRAI